MIRILVCAVTLISVCCAAHADGGRLRFSQRAGPFTVTLFTTPEPLTPGVADLSVMVQESASGKILSDASVQLLLTAPDGKNVNAVAIHGAVSNQLLQAAEVRLPTPGKWHLQLNILQAGRSAAWDGDIVVESGSRIATLVWVFALLPLLAVFLFVLHQQQKERAKQRHSLHG